MAHEDVVPYEFGGKLVTGGHDDVLGTDNFIQRVFGLDFGEDPFDPFVIGDPGFNNADVAGNGYPNNAALTIGKTVGLQLLTNLQYWDGTGGVAFGSPDANVELRFKNGSPERAATGTSFNGTTLAIETAINGGGGQGRIHDHIDTILNYSGSADSAAPNAPDGIYLIGARLLYTDNSLTSDPIYFVFLNNVAGLLGDDLEAEEIHDAAIDYVQATLVPEPSGIVMAMLGAMGVILVHRRRAGRPLAAG